MATDLEQLGRAVKAAQYRQHRTLEAAFQTIETTVVQWDALRALAASPGASGHALALATFQTDQSFGTLALRLEAKGMVQRLQGQGRQIRHVLTAAGAQKLAEANAIAGEVREGLFAPLEEPDRRDLARVLALLLAAG